MVSFAKKMGGGLFMATVLKITAAVDTLDVDEFNNLGCLGMHTVR